MNKTVVILTKEIKVKLLRAIQSGEINMVEFPLLQAAEQESIRNEVAEYNQEQKRVLLKLARSIPPEYYAFRKEISIPLTSGVKQRLLKAMQTGTIDMTDFAQLRITGGQHITIELDEFTPEELQTLFNLSFTTHKPITTP